MKPTQEDAYWRRQRRIRLVNDDGNLTSLISRLDAMSGVIKTELTEDILEVEYDLRKVDQRAIRAVISARGVVIGESGWEQVKRWIIEYKEAIRGAEEFVDYGWDAWIQDAYVNRYKLRRHGQRDDRLTNWRQYEVNNGLDNSNNSQAN